jgi:hypothetical protein
MRKVDTDVLWKKEKPNGTIRVSKVTFVGARGVHTYKYQVCLFKKNKPSRVAWSSSWVTFDKLVENINIVIRKANGTSF